MTFDPAQLLPSSAVELRDDDGKRVCTIYGRESGIEIVCQQGWSAEFGVAIHPNALIQHLGVTFTRDTEARRR